MIGYLDMTFCPYWEKCSDSQTCPRALTQDVLDGAKKWWGESDAPIAMFSEKPSCFKEIPCDTL